MAVSYAPLFYTLHEKKIKLVDLQRKFKWSTRTSAKFNKDEYVSMKVIDDICSELNCEVQDVVKHVKPK